MKTTISLIILGLLLTGCMVSTKAIIYEKDAVNYWPPPVKIGASATEEGEAPEWIMPDGTYFSLPHGTAGNLIMLNNLNDGTEQRGAATAAAAVNSPSADVDADTVVEDEAVEPEEAP